MFVYILLVLLILLLLVDIGLRLKKFNPSGTLIVVDDTDSNNPEVYLQFNQVLSEDLLKRKWAIFKVSHK